MHMDAAIVSDRACTSAVISFTSIRISLQEIAIVAILKQVMVVQPMCSEQAAWTLFKMDINVVTSLIV
jgi:hypothetical protein